METIDFTIEEYRYIWHPKNGLKIYRHGIEWRDETGDNALYMLMQKYSDLINK